jgi:UrcA family protein
MLRFAYLATAAALALAPVAASAEPDTPHVRVNFADLNLDSPDGVHELYDRIRAASHIVCGPAPAISNLEQTEAYGQCLDATVSRAVYNMRLPALTTLAQSPRTVQSASR